MYFAAASSLPGGFVVLILTSSTSHSCASRANPVVSPTSVGLGGMPIAGGFCAIWPRVAPGCKPCTNTNTATQKLRRFQCNGPPPKWTMNVNDRRKLFCTDEKSILTCPLGAYGQEVTTFPGEHRLGDRARQTQ